MANNLPGTGLMGWLGRQLGYVRRAIRHPVGPSVVYRQKHVEEAKLPDDPNVTLRRTVTDEVIVKEPQRKMD